MSWSPQALKNYLEKKQTTKRKIKTVSEEIEFYIKQLRESKRKEINSDSEEDDASFNLPTVSKHQLKKTFELLEGGTSPKKSRASTDVISACSFQRRSNRSYEEIMMSWDRPTYIIRYLREAILKHDWNILTHLLLFLLPSHIMYRPFIKEVSK